jgi:HAD superfamily hydrolase (TIGR01509 family)
MKRISCIIFDLDGTLGQTNDLIFATFNHLAERYLGKKFAPEEIIAMFGPPEEIAIAKMLGDKFTSDAMNEYYRFYADHHLAMAKLHTGVRGLLEHLKATGFILAVFTGKGKRTTLVTLEKFGIKQYFDLIVTGSDVKNHKPSADGILNVLRTFSLNPTEVLMVGDAISDVKAAHDAGVLIAAVLWDSYSKHKILEMELDYIFHTVEEFETWVKKLAPPMGNVTV